MFAGVYVHVCSSIGMCVYLRRSVCVSMSVCVCMQQHVFCVLLYAPPRGPHSLWWALKFWACRTDFLWPVSTCKVGLTDSFCSSHALALSNPVLDYFPMCFTLRGTAKALRIHSRMFYSPTATSVATGSLLQAVSCVNPDSQHKRSVGSELTYLPGTCAS